MFPRLRLMVFLLLVALPLQGIASSARALCDHVDVAGAQSVTAATRAAPHDHRHGDVADTATHHDGAHAGDHGASVHAPAFADEAVDAGAGSCAHCAACSVGTALIGRTVGIVVSASAHADFPSQESILHTRPVGGPERPPRTI